MLDSLAPQRGTVLAFDFGEKRIGVAVGEWALGQSHPLAAICSEANRERFAAIAALLAEWQPASLVVGLPLALDGSAHAMTARCIRFANQLRGRFALPVIHVDERLSSAAAEERLRENRRGAPRSAAAKAQIDSLAAQIILQSLFDDPHGSVVADPASLSRPQETPCH